MERIELKVGEELKQVRKAIKMSSGRLGELCEVTSSYISRIESGNVKETSYTLINKAIIGITNEIITMNKVDRDNCIEELNAILEEYNNSILEHILYRLRSRRIKQETKEIDVLDKTKMIINSLNIMKDFMELSIEDLVNIHKL